LTPLLSLRDDEILGEGSLDPLGLYATADRLAVQLVPGVRERQQHPRFLTALAVSLHVTSSFPDDIVASDGVSEPAGQLLFCKFVFGSSLMTVAQAFSRSVMVR